MNETVESISKNLFSTLWKTNIVPRNLKGIPPVPSVVQRNISKHSLNKPTTNGNGDTSAILTDIKGFREVLELSLIFHALVHEYHQLPAVWQNDLENLKEKMDTLMTSILTKIYRGDDGIDAATCKCHSHYHIIDDIRYFGDPMGYNASTGERNIKWWAKRISKTARKCDKPFSWNKLQRESRINLFCNVPMPL